MDFCKGSYLVNVKNSREKLERSVSFWYFWHLWPLTPSCATTYCWSSSEHVFFIDTDNGLTHQTINRYWPTENWEMFGEQKSLISLPGLLETHYIFNFMSLQSPKGRTSVSLMTRPACTCKSENVHIWLSIHFILSASHLCSQILWHIKYAKHQGLVIR